MTRLQRHLKKKTKEDNMKRVFILGRAVRIVCLLLSVLLLGALTEMCIHSGFAFIDLMILIACACLVGFGIYYMYSMGIFADYKRNRLRIVTGLLARDRKEVALSGVESIDVSLDRNRTMIFTIHYTYNRKETVAYTFFRISFVEKWQYRRIKKELDKLIMKPAAGDH